MKLSCFGRSLKPIPSGHSVWASGDPRDLLAARSARPLLRQIFATATTTAPYRSLGPEPSVANSQHLGFRLGQGAATPS